MSSCVYKSQCPCEQDGSLQSVCTLNGCCREESACYYTTCQQTRVRRSEVVVAEINSAESFCSTGQFLAHDSSSYTFVIAKVSTQRKTRPFLHKLASSLNCHSVLFLQFACGAWPSTGKNVVRVSRIRSAKIKTAKRVCRHFLEILQLTRYTVYLHENCSISDVKEQQKRGVQLLLCVNQSNTKHGQGDN